jgi:hypothetical protein
VKQGGDVMGSRAGRIAWVCGIGILLLAALPHAQEYPFNQRPTDVTVIMSSSRGKYDGTYTASQTSSTCGEVPMEMSFAGAAAFTVQFPDGGDSEISDLAFSSKALVGGVLQTDTFSLSVSVKSPRIGQPSAYVLNTQQPKMTGTATLTTPSAGTTRLKVAGVNDRGETIEVTVVCKPRR